MPKLTKEQLKNRKKARCPCRNEPIDKCTCPECNDPKNIKRAKRLYLKLRNKKLKRSTDEILKEIDKGK